MNQEIQERIDRLQTERQTEGLTCAKEVELLKLRRIL